MEQAFTLLKPEPSPLNAPPRINPAALLVTTKSGSALAAIGPETLAATRAYGTGVSCWRGASVVKAFAPLVLTAISSQLLAPMKTGPKSTVVVNRPWFTATAAFVTGPATAAPLLFVVNNVNVRS